MTRLMISVRSIAQAATAIHNGADIIDVRSPGRSPAMASPDTIRAIARETPPRIPIAASVGEWVAWRREGRFPALPGGLSYVQLGLAGAADLDGWREELGRFRHEVAARQEIFCEAEWAAVAPADWREARAPRPEDVLDFAAANGFPVFCIAASSASGPGLFDRLDPDAVARLAETGRRAGVDVAVGGALRPAEIDRVLAIGPDILVLDVAAMTDGPRGVDPAAVRGFSARIVEDRRVASRAAGA